MATTFLDPENKLQHDAWLWRYMKLSTFLLLLEGKAFLPTVQTLKGNDPLEGSIGPDSPWLLATLSDSQNKLDPALTKWLLGKAAPHEKIIPGRDQFTAKGNSDLLQRLYVRELIQRRAVWCWYTANLESAAMWTVYGPNGVAIRSSLSALMAALPDSIDFQIAKIRYVDRRPSSGDRFNPEAPRDAQLIHRPHFLKVKEYEDERELRVATICSSHKTGVIIDVNAQTLMKEIILSPLMVRGEARAVNNIVNSISWENKPEVRLSSLSSAEADLDATFGETLDEALDRHGFSEQEEIPSLLTSL